MDRGDSQLVVVNLRLPDLQKCFGLVRGLNNADGNSDEMVISNI